jgi:hypothetical protein
MPVGGGGGEIFANACSLASASKRRANSNISVFRIGEMLPDAMRGSKEVVLKQSGIDKLPIELKRLGIESDAELPQRNPRDKEHRGDRCKTSSAIRQVLRVEPLTEPAPIAALRSRRLRK